MKNFFSKIKQVLFGFKFRAPINKTYIFPNLYGFLFGGISFVLLLMAMGYSNNLLYFFVFFLISVAVTGMWLTNKNIDRVKFDSLTADSIFAGEDNTLKLTCVVIPDRLFPHLSTFMIQMQCFDRVHQQQKTTEQSALQERTQIPLIFKPNQRGQYALPRIQLESTFPFSMLRAWKYFQDSKKVIIYPSRKGSSKLPLLTDLNEDEKKFLQNDQQNDDTVGLFSHHREFQNNDPVYRIDWKRSAKFDKLFIKKYEDDRSQKQILSWGMTKNLDNQEARVSQLALWVDICEKNLIEYRLLLPHYKSGFGQGEIHYKNCMETLALFEENNV